jgi:hypothetical protein
MSNTWPPDISVTQSLVDHVILPEQLTLPISARALASFWWASWNALSVT